jgi:hypothetical protein
MSVSVVVPSLLTNPAFEEALESIVVAAAAVGGEVLVAANGAGPRRHPPVLDRPPVRLLESASPGAANARNVAMAEARHPILLFADDDCVVPPDWCAILRDGLRHAAAVTGPVDVRPAGPITAFLNYQRFWDAAPLDGRFARFLVTSNAAIDRTRIRARFDPRMRGAEDLELGYRIRRGGERIAWLEMRPVVQVIADGIDQMTRRFLTWGTDFAVMHAAGHPLVPGPYVPTLYADLCRGAATGGRQFRELPDPTVRSAFASLDRVHVALCMAGFLAGIGDRTGHRFIALDREALAAGLRRLFAARAGEWSTVDWTDLRPDPAGLTVPAEPVDDLRAEIGELLTAAAPLLAAEPPAGARQILDRVPANFADETGRSYRAIAGIAADLPGTGGTMPRLHHAIRAAGVEFNQAMSMLEGLFDPVAAGPT